MANTYQGYVRRIDFEPKMEYLESKTYAHVFLILKDGQQVDVYTENPRLEAAFLTAYSLSIINEPRYVEVQYEQVGPAGSTTNKVIRVTLDKDFV